MTEPLVVAVILNTNRCADTLACLESLSVQDYPRLQSIVLDNASTDGSVEAVSAAYPDVRIMHLEQNRGYAGNNNVGIQAAVEAGADWVFVLNEDVILAQNAVRKLVEAVNHSVDYGVVGPLVLHYDEPDVIQSAGGVLNRRWLSYHAGQNDVDKGQYVSPRRVDWISGCAIMVSRDMIAQVGMLDERFFYYWEETEWCLRGRKAGYHALMVPAARIWHKGVQRSYQPSANVTYYWARNWLLLLQKHRAPISAWLYAFAYTGRSLLAWTFLPRWRSMHQHRNALLQGLGDFFRHRWGIRPS